MKLNVKKSFDGEFLVYNFYNKNPDDYIGHVHLRLKKGWNQIHVEIDNQNYRGKGISFDMIEYQV